MKLSERDEYKSDRAKLLDDNLMFAAFLDDDGFGILFRPLARNGDIPPAIFVEAIAQMIKNISEAMGDAPIENILGAIGEMITTKQGKTGH